MGGKGKGTIGIDGTLGVCIYTHMRSRAVIAALQGDG